MMATNILFSDRDESWAVWERPLRQALAERGIAADLHRSYDQPEKVEFVIYSPASPLQDFTPYTSLKAVLSMWAGVESIERNQTLQAPLARMVDPGLTEGMVEYVTAHILRHHLGLDFHIHNNQAEWRPDLMPPLARHRCVGFLGLGALGLACANAARDLNFNVHGWSRRPKTEPGITCHSGDRGLREVLGLSEVLVLLLPHTQATENIIDAKTLARLPKGASIINPGRGHLIVDDDLLEAIDQSHISHATLDVFRTEPLPESHAFWTHERVTVTPHIAAETRPKTASHVIANNIALALSGKPLLNLVDRKAGY